ncbi:SDR family NAD(P)-dependent oxidoreductase [Sphingobium sp. Sx8-8]|uniref:SDR family NAD(P)-dependent oxidoreductase n=1 Tax=Sphingobium sp. Sx8-8 TaxID=2933617 RepID=UPI001F597ABE|nr:SDR family NAD(P)-dependent oxidoreductase [Sphingobium sp. Sx8-8]
MVDDLQGKVILVTGGAAGLGEAIVRKGGALGARMAVVDRNREAAVALAAQVEGARAYAADVAVLVDMERVCAEVVADFGRLDGAVNNAGIGGEWGDIVECTPATWDATIAVNLTGVYNSLKAQIPHILAAGGGSIVNMASMAGLLAEPALPAYIAAKHGVVGLTKSVALDFGVRGVRCNAVCPSFIRTPMTEAGLPDPAFWEMITQRHPIKRLVTAEEVANATIFLLSAASGGMTGSVHLLDGGIGVE